MGPPGYINVYDANDQLLGAALDYCCSVYIKSTNQFAAFYVQNCVGNPCTPLSVAYPETPTFYFSGPNCTGTLYGYFYNSQILYWYTPPGGSAGLYVMQSAGDPLPYSFQSDQSYSSGGVCYNGSYQIGGNGVRPINMVSVDPSTLPFTLPIALPLHYAAAQ
jgi:hypothetical protein